MRAIIARVISASSMEKSKAPSALKAPMVTTACLALKRAICSMASAPIFCSDSGRYSPPIMNTRLPLAPILPAISSELVITVMRLSLASSRAKNSVVVPVSISTLSPRA